MTRLQNIWINVIQRFILFSFDKRSSYFWFVIVELFILLNLENRIVFNPSISEPQGYYFVRYPSYYKKGDLVEICLQEKKYLEVLRQLKLPFTNNECSSHMDFLLKEIVAVGGDLVEINDHGVSINGILQKNSIPLASYAGKKLYPTERRSFILKKNEFFVLGMTPHSYDSRYFGVIDKSQIKATAYLIWKF